MPVTNSQYTHLQAKTLKTAVEKMPLFEVNESGKVQSVDCNMGYPRRPRDSQGVLKPLSGGVAAALGLGSWQNAWLGIAPGKTG